MLYDPKWETQTETKPDLFSVAGLIAWLETKDPATTYCYEEAGACLLTQYFRENGFPEFHCGTDYGYWYSKEHKDGTLPQHFNDIALGRMDGPYKHTFGAALARARKVIG
jgi:hypothetical protein